MESLLSVALSNAIAITLLALIALLAGRCLRRPALTHALWLLVLLKLLTPPLVRVPVRWPSPPPLEETEARPSSAELAIEEVRIVVGEVEKDADVLAATPAAEEPPVVDEAAPQSAEIWPFILGALWLSGSLAWLALAWRRVRSLRRLLRFATPAPAWLTAEVHELATRLGLRRVPGTWLVPGKLSPMLWTLGGPPRLLLPAELLAALGEEKRATLLLHELAHLHRRDHWVRWLELLATALYWWHPIVWWARRELREAEEQCCDAWVVWALPGAGRTYAAALLECVDFLSDVPGPLPVGASGLGHVADLKRRLTMIVQGTTPRRLTRGGLIALLGAAALLLPCLPSWAQDDRDKPPMSRDPRPAADAKDIAKARADVEKLRDELAAQIKKVHEAEERLREAAQRLHKVEGKGEGRDIRVIIIRGDGAGGGGTRVEWPRFAPGGGGLPPIGAGPPRGPEGGGDFRKPVPAPMGGGGRGDDQRIQDLERRLNDIMRELTELRRHMRGPGAGPGTGGGPPGGGAGPMGPGGGGGFVPRKPGTGDRPGAREEEEDRAPRRKPIDEPRP